MILLIVRVMLQLFSHPDETTGLLEEDEAMSSNGNN